MSDRIVPDIKTSFDNCTIKNGDITADDIDWCTGFWNEMDGETIPSLYPDSPIFSTKEYDWENSVLFENVFVTPDIEETFSGTIFNGHPAFIERVKNEDNCSAFFPFNDCEPNTILQVGPRSPHASQQKYKRPRKPKGENAQENPSKRQRTGSSKKKPKIKK